LSKPQSGGGEDANLVVEEPHAAHAVAFSFGNYSTSGSGICKHRALVVPGFSSLGIRK